MWNARDGSERGAAAVEFALIFPVFIAAVFGMFTGGMAYDQKQQLTHAAREGARYGAAVPLAQFESGDAWADHIAQVTEDRANGDLSVEGATICAALVEGTPPAVVDGTYTTDGGGEACFDDGGADAARRVQVRVTRPANIWVVVFDIDVTLSSSGVSRHEGRVE